MSDEAEHDNREDPLGYIYCRDEILQMMYWMTGEGFGHDFAVSDLRKFLNADEDRSAKNLERKDGFRRVARGTCENRYSLSSLGKKEGGRQFADDFESMTMPGHFECDEPDCDCQNLESTGGARKNLLRADSSDHNHWRSWAIDS
jgi:hypothetical protein